MIKKITLACLFLVSISIYAQDSLKVKISPNNGYDRMMLYKLSGAKQQYIANTSIKNEEFIFIVPENSEPGMYRLFYDIEKGGYIDVIYNQEPISVTFDPLLPNEAAEFDLSDENKIYQSYINSIEPQQLKLDSLQIANFTSKEENVELEKIYQNGLKNVEKLQAYFEKESIGKLAYEFIKGNKKYNSPKLASTVDEYLESLETHFFDNIDFTNKKLVNSSFFIDKAMEYVFYLSGSEDAEALEILRKKSVKELMSKIGDNNFIKSEVLSSLLYAFAGQEDLALVDFVKETYYNNLPVEFKNQKFLATINNLLKTAIGRNAPEIFWKEGSKTMHLSGLNESENYIVTFWSTTCSHCLKEIPELYNFTKDKENVKVIAVALEDDKFGFDHHTLDMPNWINVLGLNKWENQIARSYDVHATPSYFVLDKNKKIIAKPEELHDVLEFFKTEE